jgi:transmembrane sensor
VSPREQKRIDKHRLEEAASWKTRLAEDESAADFTAFETWLNAHPANRAAYAQVENACNAVSDLAREPELIALRGGAFETARRASRARWAGMFWSAPMRAVAFAAMLLLVCIGAGSLAYLTPRVYETGAAERRVVALEDGSRVSMDASTLVRVRYDGARRRLWLERGRAIFDVAHDPLRPFTVQAKHRTVVATGTSFGVELLNRDVRVVLYEGSIAVLEQEPNGAEQPVRVQSGAAAGALLTPGHELISTPGTLAVTAPIDPVRSRAWEAGQLVFDNEPMRTAVARVNRYTTTPITVGDNAVGNLRVSGVFTAGDVQAFVDGVTTLMPVTAEHGEHAILLRTDAERAP